MQQVRGPALVQEVLQRPRVLLGRVAGVQGLPQVTANPLYTNALGAVKSLAHDLQEGASKRRDGGGFLGRLKNLF